MHKTHQTRALSWDTFLDTYLPALIFALGTGIALPSIPALAQSFDVSFGVASYVLTAFLLGGMIGTIPTGWLVDRIGRRKIMLLGPLLTALFAFLVTVAQSFPELLVLRFLDGWTAQMWLIGRMAGISARASADQRGKQVAFMFGFDGVGRLAGPIAGGFLATALGLRAPFAAYAIMSVLALVPVALFIRDVEEGAGERPVCSDQPAGIARIVQVVQPRLSFFAVSIAGALARGPIFAGLFLLYAAFRYHVGPQSIGLLATASGVLALPVGFLAGWMMDHFGRRRALIPGYTACGATVILVGLTALLHASYAWFVGVYLAVVVTQNLTNGSLQTIGADIAPPEARGLFLGAWNFSGQSGSALGPVIFAVVADRTGYLSAFTVLGLATISVAVMLATYIPETSRPIAARLPPAPVA